MISATEDFKKSALSNLRDPRVRVKVTWADSSIDHTVASDSNDKNRGAIMSQVTDGIREPTYKWAYLSTGFGTNELIADGSFHPMPSDLVSGQIGWYNSIASDMNGEWTINPVLSIFFRKRPLKDSTLKIFCDSIYNEFSVDFTVRFYNDDQLLHTKEVRGNTELNAKVNFMGINDLKCSKMDIEILKWNTAYGIVKITEVQFNLEKIYYDYEVVSLSITEEMEVEEGSLPIGNISSNEIDLALSNENDRFSHGNTESMYHTLLKKDRKIEVWLGFVLPPNSSDVSNGDYIVETIKGKKVGYVPYGVYWSDDWITDKKSLSVKTFARDRMEVFRRLEFDDSGVYYNITLYDLAKTVMVSAQKKIVDIMKWEIDEALKTITIPCAYFEKKSYFEAIKKIVVAGITTAYIDRTGTIIIGKTVIKPSGGLLTPAVWGQSTYFNLTVSPKTSEITNHIAVKAKSIVFDTSESSIYSSDDQYTIPAGETTLTISLAWESIPVGPDTVKTFLTNVAGTSAIIKEQHFAWGGYITVQGIAGNVFKLSATGVKGVMQSENEYITQDSESVLEYGKKVYNFPDNHLIQSFALSKKIADTLLPVYKEIRKDATVSWPGNAIVELSDPIFLTEYKNKSIETKSYFYILSQSITFNGSLHTQTELRRIV